MQDLIRYSKLEKKMNLNFLRKKYKESDYTILYDVGMCNYSVINYHLLKDLKNLVIDNTVLFGVNVPSIQAKNIYFLDNENLGGITIPYNEIVKNDRGYYFYWTETDKSKIEKINIITKDGVKTINVDNLKNIRIEKRKYIASFSISYEDNKKIMEYIINRKEQIKEKKLTYFLDKSDIKNNAINLSDYIDYEEIVVDINNDIRVKDLIIDKTCMDKLYKLYDAIGYIHYDRLIIVDDNEMKLRPDITILYNISPKDIEIFQDSKNTFYILYKKEKLIYMENSKIKVIDYKKMCSENKDINNINIYLEEHNFKHDLITITKYKNNSNKISSFYKTIEIDELFNEFNLYNLDKYYEDNIDEVKTLLKNNDWYTMFDKKYIHFYKLKIIYIDFLEFLNRINILKHKGFSNKAIKYLCENHFNNILGYDSENNNFDIDDMTKEEIDKFNDLGDIYIKRKQLINSRCSNEEEK